MKKQILFLCSNMGVGGFQKSLVSLLRCFDYDRYDVDLLLFNPEGIFMDLIPPEVHILPTVIEPAYFGSGPQAVLAMLKRGKIGKAIIRLLSCGLWVFDKSVGAAFMIKAVPKIKKHYDAAIDYNGQQILYYLVDKVDSVRKISFFHSDYKRWPYYEKKDRVYYNKVNAVVSVSDECVQSLREVFPEYTDKIFRVENINSAKTVNLYPVGSNRFCDDFKGIRLVTVGRVCYGKGFDYALEALQFLIRNEIPVQWYFVGPVTEKEFCEKFLTESGVSDHVTLLGATQNPYDYMREADIIVQPSRFEGKSVAIEEAKLLHRPIVTTNFSTVRNQIEDEKTGLIVDMNGQAVYEGIRRLITDEALRQQIINYQIENCKGNEEEVNRVYALIEGENL